MCRKEIIFCVIFLYEKIEKYPKDPCSSKVLIQKVMGQKFCFFCLWLKHFIYFWNEMRYKFLQKLHQPYPDVLKFYLAFLSYVSYIVEESSPLAMFFIFLKIII